METNQHPQEPRHHVKIVRHIPSDPILDKPARTGEAFHHASQVISSRLGSPSAFGLAVLLIVIWISSGPFFNFSDTWQLVINTTTTIVTFLMVFAIQNTQNRDAKAMQTKLDELIRSNRSARTEFVDIEELSDSELDALHGQFKDLHDKFQKKTS